MTIGAMLQLCSVVFGDFNLSGDHRYNLLFRLPIQPFPRCPPSLHLDPNQIIIMKVEAIEMDMVVTMFQLVRGGGVRPYVLHLREGFFMETIIVVQLCVEPWQNLSV